MSYSSFALNTLLLQVEIQAEQFMFVFIPVVFRQIEKRQQSKVVFVVLFDNSLLYVSMHINNKNANKKGNI
jgi:hypothetical protein